MKKIILVAVAVFLGGCAGMHGYQEVTIEEEVTVEIQTTVTKKSHPSIKGGYSMLEKVGTGTPISLNGDVVTVCDPVENYFFRRANLLKKYGVPVKGFNSNDYVYIVMNPSAARNRLNDGGCYTLAKNLAQYKGKVYHRLCGNLVVRIGESLNLTTTKIVQKTILEPVKKQARSYHRIGSGDNGGGNTSSGNRSRGDGHGSGKPSSGNRGRGDGDGGTPAKTEHGSRSDGSGGTPAG